MNRVKEVVRGSRGEMPTVLPFIWVDANGKVSISEKDIEAIAELVVKMLKDDKEGGIT